MINKPIDWTKERTMTKDETTKIAEQGMMAVNILKKCVEGYNRGASMNLDIVRGAAMSSSYILFGTLVDLDRTLGGDAKRAASKHRDKLRTLCPTMGTGSASPISMERTVKIIKEANEISDFLHSTFKLLEVHKLSEVSLAGFGDTTPGKGKKPTDETLSDDG